MFDELLHILCIVGRVNLNCVPVWEREWEWENIYEVDDSKYPNVQEIDLPDWALLGCFKTLLFRVDSLNHRVSITWELQTDTLGPTLMYRMNLHLAKLPGDVLYQLYHLCNLSPKILALDKTLHFSLSPNTYIGLKGHPRNICRPSASGSSHMLLFCLKLSFHKPSLPFHWLTPTWASGSSFKSSDHLPTSSASLYPTLRTPLVSPPQSPQVLYFCFRMEHRGGNCLKALLRVRGQFLCNHSLVLSTYLYLLEL